MKPINQIIQLDHQVGVNIAENCLVKDGQSVPVEPKVMALLVYFINHPGEVLSRDQLVAEVWQGSVVSDSTVNWSVSQLRKLLDDKTGEPRFIKTISKKGYQWIAQASCESTAKLPAKSTRIHPVWLLMPVLLAIASVVLWPQPSQVEQQPSYTLTNHQPVTRMAGQEEDPGLSPDGKFLLFRHRPPGAQGFQLYLKPMVENQSFNVTGNDGQLTGQQQSSRRSQNAYALTHGDPHYHHAIWAQDDYRIVAVRTLTNNQCQIVSLSLQLSRLEISDEQVLTHCHTSGQSKLAAGKQLYFTDRRDSEHFQLFSLNEQQQVQPISQAESTGYGIRYIDMAPNQQQLLVLRDIGWTQTEFAVFDPTKQSKQVLFNQNSVYYSAHWGPKGEDIWLNSGNDKVYAYNIQSKQSRLLMSTATGWNYNARPAGKNAALYSVSDANSSDLVFHNAPYSNEKTPFGELTATFAHTSSKLAYLSNESGLPQIWLKQPDQADSQLTDAREYYEISDLQFSHDDQSLLGKSGHFIASIDLASQRFRLHYNQGNPAFFPSWTQDNRHILFTRNDDNRWRLYKVAVSNSPEIPEPLNLDGYIARPLSDDTILFNRYDKPGLWSYDLNTEQLSEVFSALPAQAYWQRLGEQFYFVARQDGKVKLFKTPLKQFDPQPIIDMPANSGQRFDIRLDKNGRESIVMVDFARQASDIRKALIYRAGQPPIQ